MYQADKKVTPCAFLPWVDRVGGQPPDGRRPVVRRPTDGRWTYGRPAGRPGGALVVSGAEKKSFDRGGPVWPPRSNVTNDRLGGGHILLWRWVPLPFQTGGGDVACWPKTWPELNWPDLTWFSRIFDLILMAFWLQNCNMFTLSWQRWCSNFHGFLNPNFDGFWIDFWIRSENIDFVKIVLPPAREHDF